MRRALPGLYAVTRCNSVGAFFSQRKTKGFPWGSEFSSYEIELQNRVMQDDITLWVTNSKV